jgi:hypothetical protein
MNLLYPNILLIKYLFLNFIYKIIKSIQENIFYVNALNFLESCVK